MKNLKTYLGLAMLILSMNSFAGQGGNGGDAVVCSDGSVRLLDYVEGEFYGQKISLEGDDLREKVFNTLDRLKGASPNFVKNLKNYSDELILDINTLMSNLDLSIEELNKKTKSTSFTDGDLVDLPDSDHKVVPKGCEIKQVAIHADPANFIQRRYVMQANLVSAMDLTHQAGLVIHEAIYRIASLKLKHESSIQTRSLNTYIASDLILSDTKEKIVERLVDFEMQDNKREKRSDYCIVDFYKQGLYLDSDHIYVEENYIYGKLCQNFEVQFGSFNLKTSYGRIKKYEQGSVKGLYVHLGNNKFQLGNVLFQTFENFSLYIENQDKVKVSFELDNEERYKVGDRKLLYNVIVKAESINQESYYTNSILYTNQNGELAVMPRGLKTKLPSGKKIACGVISDDLIVKKDDFNLDGTINVNNCELKFNVTSLKELSSTYKNKELSLTIDKIIFENNKVVKVVIDTLNAHTRKVTLSNGKTFTLKRKSSYEVGFDGNGRVSSFNKTK